MNLTDDTDIEELYRITVNTDVFLKIIAFLTANIDRKKPEKTIVTLELKSDEIVLKSSNIFLHSMAFIKGTFLKVAENEKDKVFVSTSVPAAKLQNLFLTAQNTVLTLSKNFIEIHSGRTSIRIDAVENNTLNFSSNLSAETETSFHISKTIFKELLEDTLHAGTKDKVTLLNSNKHKKYFESVATDGERTSIVKTYFIDVPQFSVIIPAKPLIKVLSGTELQDDDMHVSFNQDKTLMILRNDDANSKYSTYQWFLFVNIKNLISPDEFSDYNRILDHFIPVCKVALNKKAFLEALSFLKKRRKDNTLIITVSKDEMILQAKQKEQRIKIANEKKESQNELAFAVNIKHLIDAVNTIFDVDIVFSVDKSLQYMIIEKTNEYVSFIEILKINQNQNQNQNQN